MQTPLQIAHPHCVAGFSDFLSIPVSSFFSVFFSCVSCFLKKRTLWPLERALNLPQLPPQQQAPEPQGSTLRLWSTAPKTLVLLTLKVPFAALCPSPPSAHLLAFLINKSCIYVPFDMEQDFGKKLHAVLSLYVHACNCVWTAKIEFALGCFHTQGDLFTVQWIFSLCF